MAVEIAKESSDMFPPVKAVTAALSVLTKNYDASPLERPILSITKIYLQQTHANAGQIKDIEERVQSLCKVLSSPVGDQDREEKARRESLRTFVHPHYGVPAHC